MLLLAVLLIQTLVSIGFSYKFLRMKVFSFVTVHCFFCFPKCSVFWAWFCLNQNGCKHLWEAKGNNCQYLCFGLGGKPKCKFTFLLLVIYVSKYTIFFLSFLQPIIWDLHASLLTPEGFHHKSNSFSRRYTVGIDFHGRLHGSEFIHSVKM